jgi:hypothetical protein
MFNWGKVEGCIEGCGVTDPEETASAVILPRSDTDLEVVCATADKCTLRSGLLGGFSWELWCVCPQRYADGAQREMTVFTSKSYFLTKLVQSYGFM